MRRGRGKREERMERKVKVGAKPRGNSSKYILRPRDEEKKESGVPAKGQFSPMACGGGDGGVKNEGSSTSD